MQLSIVICSYNRASYISDALDSLYKQTAGLNTFEAIIVDNNSTDNTAEVFRQWNAAHNNGSFTYITETNQGASFARNTGAAVARGQWLCFMDDDAVATPNYVENILKHIETKPDAVGFGGRIIPKYIPAFGQNQFARGGLGRFALQGQSCRFCGARHLAWRH